jgi:NADH-quinone oxidoreductase subunit M
MVATMMNEIVTLLMAGVPFLGALLCLTAWSRPDQLKQTSIVMTIISLGATIGLSPFLAVPPEGFLLLYLLPLAACASILGQPTSESHRSAWMMTLVFLGLGLSTLASHGVVGQSALLVLFGLVIGLLYRHHSALWQMSWWGIGAYGVGAAATVVSAVAEPPFSVVASLVACATLLPLVPLHSGYFTALTRLPGNLPSFIVVLFPTVGLHGLVSVTQVLPNNMAVTVMGLAVIGALYGAVKALAQSRMRLLLAYGSLSLFSMLWWFAAATGITTVWAPVFVGAVSFSTSGLLLAWQAIRTRYGDDVDPQAVSGLASTMPRFAVLLSLVALAVIGLPPFGVFSGFIGLLLTSPIASPTVLFLILAAWLATSWYVLDAVQRLLFGQQRADLPFKDLQQSEFVALLMVVLIVIALGVIPAGVLGPESVTPLMSAVAGSFVWNK